MKEIYSILEHEKLKAHLLFSRAFDNIYKSWQTPCSGQIITGGIIAGEKPDTTASYIEEHHKMQ